MECFPCHSEHRLIAKTFILLDVLEVMNLSIIALFTLMDTVTSLALSADID